MHVSNNNLLEPVLYLDEDRVLREEQTQHKYPSQKIKKNQQVDCMIAWITNMLRLVHICINMHFFLKQSKARDPSVKYVSLPTEGKSVFNYVINLTIY